MYSYTTFFFIFNWRIIALQYFISFCHKTTCIGHKYTCVPSLLNLPHPTPLGCYRHQVELLVPIQWLLTILHTVVHTCYALSSSHALLPLLCPKSVPCVCISIPALHICSSVPCFWIPYTCVNIQNLFFSVLLHSVQQILRLSISLELTQMHSFLWLNSIPLVGM